MLALAVEAFTLEDLPPDLRSKYSKVLAEGTGVCSRCRWRSGCISCDPSKAWKYYAFQSLGLEDKDPGKAGEVKKNVKGGGEAKNIAHTP